MMVKILYCASTTSHLRNFHLPYMQWMDERGCEVTALADDGEILPNTVEAKKVPFTKKMWSPRNIKSIFQVRRMLAKGKFGLIVTNTTLAGAVVRAAVVLLPKARRPKVLHICHGFLFGVNSGVKKNLLLLPELVCAKVTDIFATMNQESDNIARKYKLGKQIVFTRGMGIDIGRFSRALPESNAFNFVCVGDFSKRKNQSALIRAFGKAAVQMPDARLVFAGDGAMTDECRKLAHDINIGECVDFLGYVKDVPKLLAECDVALSSSKSEGLPLNVMEAMASGLPVIASDIAGHRDLLPSSSLYRTEAELAAKLAEQYALGRRRVEYGNLAQYALGNVMAEWIRIYKESAGLVELGF